MHYIPLLFLTSHWFHKAKCLLWKRTLQTKGEGAVFVIVFPHTTLLLPPKQQLFATVCFLVLLPNKDTWMHHVTFMTCEVLKGAKVKGRFHGRVAISNSASELVDHHLPFPLSISSTAQTALCLHLNQLLFVDRKADVCVFDIYSCVCNFEHLNVIITGSCHISAQQIHHGTIRATEKMKACSNRKSFNCLYWASKVCSDEGQNEEIKMVQQIIQIKPNVFISSFTKLHYILAR